MKVRDIMTTGVETAAPDSSLQEIAMLMKNEDVGSIPIVDGDELTGIITDRDIVVRCVAVGKDPADTDAEDILSGDLETVEPDDEVEEAGRIMAERQIRRLPVVERGNLVGMVSIGDIAVKEDEDTAGEALEDISEGVKQSGSGRGRMQPERQPIAQAGGTRGKVQAISNRSRDVEMERQKKVSPQRAATASSKTRRRTG